MWAIPAFCLLIVLAEGLELAEALRRLPRPNPARLPRRGEASCALISVHVPVHAEPPDVVINTLRSLARSEHRRLEILVVDNNTDDDRLWRPVAEFCETMGPPYRFFRVTGLAGAKAGALNYALRQTDSAASLVAVVDSDYVVMPNFLSDAVAILDDDDQVTFVQGPQDYRTLRCHGVHTGRYYEYSRFFEVGMALRERNNALHLHGTLVVLRHAALERVQGWAEWCATEDCELGIRLLADGGRGVYLHAPCGHGLMPITIGDHRCQRHRWVAGGAQALRRHGGALLLGQGSLTTAQRLRYLQGWLPWARDGVLVLLTGIIVLGLSLGAMAPGTPSLTPLVLSCIVLLGCAAVQNFVTFTVILRLSRRDALRATGTATGLTWCIGLAWWRGLLGGPVMFRRTPKAVHCTHKSTLRTAIGPAALTAVSLIGAVLADGLSPAVAALAVLMLSVPYVCTTVDAAAERAARSAANQTASYPPDNVRRDAHVRSMTGSAA